MNNAKNEQIITFATAGLRLSKKADMKVKSADIVNRKIDDVQKEIHHLLRVPSLEGMNAADLLLLIQKTDLNDRELDRLHQLMQLHHQLGEQLEQLTEEIRKLADQTRTIAFMLDLMNAI